MKLENQVCSLELAKKLKELGVKQESLFYWTDDMAEILDNGHEKRIYRVNIYPVAQAKLKGKVYKFTKISAFTVAELGEMFGRQFDTHKSFDDNVEWVGWFSGDVHIFRAKTEADVRAKMLIYLIENKIIKAPYKK